MQFIVTVRRSVYGTGLQHELAQHDQQAAPFATEYSLRVYLASVTLLVLICYHQPRRHVLHQRSLVQCGH